MKAAGHTARRVIVCMLALLLIFSLGGCGAAGSGSASGSGTSQGGGSAAPAGKDNGKAIRIVASIFPEYDWVRNLLGESTDSAQLTLLLDNGTDMHSFQPTAEDMMIIASCDLFIFVGGESDAWVRDALGNAGNPDRITVDLLSVLGDAAKEEILLEGMQAEHEADGGTDDHDANGGSENGADSAGTASQDAGGSAGGHSADDSEDDAECEIEYDEHIWLSLRNAKICCRAIADALIKLDPDNGSTYEANFASYIEKLDALDTAYQEATQNAARKTLLFGDRFPFRYLADDYGLTCYAAFSGCSAETEASFETVIFLAEKVDALSLPCVLVIDGSDTKIAKTIVENTASKNQQILTLDSMQSVTKKDIENGETYLSVMEKNLGILKEALS